MTAQEIAEAIFAEWQASCARYPEGYPSPLGPIVERHIQPLIDLAYHTAPGEMEFAPEGWTWRQQAQRHLMRMGEMEKQIEELEARIEELNKH